MTSKTPLKSLKSLHHEHGTKKTKNISKNFSWLIAIVFFLIVILILVTSNNNLINKIRKRVSGGSNIIKINDASIKLSDFVNKTYSKSIKKMDILSSKEESGLYSFVVSVTSLDDKTSTSTVYITKDGKYFLPNTINIDEILVKIQGQQASAGGSQTTPPTDIPKTDKPVVELFTMAYCPFGNQAEDGISPVAKLLAGKAEVVPHFVIYSNYNGGSPKYCLDKEAKYCSLHGVEELKEDVRELCIYKYSRSKYWDYIDAVNKDCNVQNINDCWNGPAKKVGIDTNKILTCFDKEKTDMLDKEIAENKKYNVTGSPTVIINGASYNGGRSSEDYKQGICGSFNNPPDECGKVLGAVSASSAPAAGGCQ